MPAKRSVPSTPRKKMKNVTAENRTFFDADFFRMTIAYDRFSAPSGSFERRPYHEGAAAVKRQVFSGEDLS